MDKSLIVKEPRILFLDIETSPNLATVWSIWNQNIGLNQLLETSYTLCWSAKWKGSREVMFDSVKKSGKNGVIKSIYKLLNEADIIIHYNGKRFDVPVLNREFLIAKLPPPSPFKQIDLYQTVKKKFRFVSNKLAHVTEQLGFIGKIKTTHKLWLDCMNGDEKAWHKMEVYNKRDVTELERVYNRILPWIENHPNIGLYRHHDMPTCPTCGGTKLQSRGFQYTKTMKYRRFQCRSPKCGAWLRSNKAMPRESGNVLTHIVT
jgi:uncharacterized protein YprB with RNaseH-like and TPR domain